jgi:hypothetical protein
MRRDGCVHEECCQVADDGLKLFGRIIEVAGKSRPLTLRGDNQDGLERTTRGGCREGVARP